jgi:hypothetical protein
MTTKAASTHRYARGQLVTLTDPRDREANWSGGFKVAEPLPHGEVPRYRLVSSGHAITRTADERKLTVILATEMVGICARSTMLRSVRRSRVEEVTCE